MSATRTIAVVTGTRAEYGLLRPVMRAIHEHSELSLQTIVTGSHLLAPARTMREVAAEFAIDAVIPMQKESDRDRFDDAAALGGGLSALALRFAQATPDVVLVLGDRIEAFAAAIAASIGGIRVAHLHGGDRAEGIADEAMRHAITKLAHIHLPATEQSAHRIIAMGESPDRVHIVGSPAIDGLADIPPLDDDAYRQLGEPAIVVLLHPVGDEAATEQRRAEMLLEIACRAAGGRVLALDPNHDPGREGILAALEKRGRESFSRAAHLPRGQFVGLLKRTGLLVGNSSAGLIECGALGVRSVNIGPRQAGRESAGQVRHVGEWNALHIESAMTESLEVVRRDPRPSFEHPFGDGRTGPRVADLFATLDESAHPIRKRNTY